MRALTVSVVVMGVLIVVGTAALIVIIVSRLTQGAGAPEFSAAPIALPAGARIEALSVSGARATMALALPTGAQELVVIDLATGKRLGTVALRTAP